MQRPQNPERSPIMMSMNSTRCKKFVYSLVRKQCCRPVVIVHSGACQPFESRLETAFNPFCHPSQVVTMHRAVLFPSHRESFFFCHWVVCVVHRLVANCHNCT